MRPGDLYRRPLLTDSALSPSRFGYIHPGLPWQDVLKAYERDNLDAAIELVEAAGLGAGANQLAAYRMIEAEHLARHRGQRFPTGDWLEIEWIPDEIEVELSVLEAAVRAAVKTVADRFGYRERPPVLVTVLARETDVPWVPLRRGYHIAKKDFDKVCLPGHLTDDPSAFQAAMRHEYGHVMAYNRTMGRCPVWLHEAVATLSGDRAAPDSIPVWLSSHELDRAFRQDREDEDGARQVRSAYAQAQALGLYLDSLKGDQGVGELLDAFADNGVVQDIVRSLIAQEPADEALHQVYGRHMGVVFEQAREFARARGWT